MKTWHRLLISFFAFCFAFIYAIPNLALIFGLLLAFCGKYISGIMCLVFAWNYVKLVESTYEKTKIH